MGEPQSTCFNKIIFSFLSNCLPLLKVTMEGIFIVSFYRKAYYYFHTTGSDYYQNIKVQTVIFR